MTAISKRSSSWRKSTWVAMTAAMAVVGVVMLERFFGRHQTDSRDTILAKLAGAKEMERPVGSDPSNGTVSGCHHFNCFDVYRCGMHPTRMLVHIPDPVNYVDEKGREISPWTREFVEILEAIEDSPYYTHNPSAACIFIPPVDLLNENILPFSQARVSTLLTAYDTWNDGQNNVIFSVLPGSKPDFQPELGVPHARAMVAAAGLSTSTYRKGFDISLPTFNPEVQERTFEKKDKRKWLLVSSIDNGMQISDDPSRHLQLRKCGSPTIRCHQDHVYSYPEVLGDSTFCLFTQESRLTHTALIDAMHLGCIPVIAIDSLVLPFSESLDWKRFSIRVREHDLNHILDILEQVSNHRVQELQKQLQWIYQRHFASIKSIVHTTLDILNDRLFAHHSKTYFDWNERHSTNPLFLPHTPPATDGFTAVILTYNRPESLFAVMRRISETPSLSKIVIVWNNQEVPPPTLGEFPKIPKQFVVVRTDANVLSNRFLPFSEIKTECILSMDDDIVMLTADELEFGYQVWREFPDRIVGFPSRTHTWNNVTGRWKYESEWTSEISMVLTGAAFYHKYWNYLYTTAPNAAAKEIKKWVDDNMNCEDIAMNFMVANITGKAPIKVAPRKKFRCTTQQCINSDMLSAGIQSHMIERSDCINMFARLYGHMPLKTIEFRADPVLYKDNFPGKLKKFNDLGSL